jgi:hypothetical protein
VGQSWLGPTGDLIGQGPEVDKGVEEGRSSTLVARSSRLQVMIGSYNPVQDNCIEEHRT